jgi:hypothetical protein
MLEAISYYGMALGGTVEAGPSLIADIKASYGNTLLSLSSTLNNKLGQVSQDSSSGPIFGTGTRSLNTGNVLGGVVLDINYSSQWDSSIWETSESGGEERLVYATDVVYNFSFSDTWDFSWNSSYNFIKNILQEVIPGTVATTYSMLGYGTVGKSFTIIGSFTEEISGAAIQHRE